jgi:methylated-DNA-protein-cysteine methyltransferase-like protein
MERTMADYHHANMQSARTATVGKKSRTSSATNDFYHRIYEVVMEIPEGRVTTYGAIAAFLGARRSSRMVGYALKSVPEEMALPCHRVVNRNGELSGKHHFASSTLMRDLLESEGVRFSGEAVIMENHFWDPADPQTSQ